MAKKPISKSRTSVSSKKKGPGHPLNPNFDAPGTNRKQAKTIHASKLPSSIYASTLMNLMHGRFDEDAMLYAMTVLEEMSPRDPAEEMLISQLLFAHARVQHLTNLLGAQTSVEGIRVISEYAEKASNTYRRLMLALAEYRRPPKSGDTYAIVNQANITQQQVVQNQEGRSEIATNEQGSAADQQREPSGPSEAPSLPADTGRDGLAEILRPKSEAVEKFHRTKDT